MNQQTKMQEAIKKAAKLCTEATSLKPKGDATDEEYSRCCDEYVDKVKDQIILVTKSMGELDRIYFESIDRDMAIYTLVSYSAMISALTRVNGNLMSIIKMLIRSELVSQKKAMVIATELADGLAD